MSSQVTLNVSDVPHFYYKDVNTKVGLTVDLSSDESGEFYLTADEISNLVLVLQALEIDNEVIFSSTSYDIFEQLNSLEKNSEDYNKLYS